MNIETNEKRTIEFERIRSGTVFECGDKIYLKGKTDNDDVAINLVTGSVIWPDRSVPNKWDKCHMHLNASIKL